MVVKNLIQAQQFQLAGSGCSASATSITLKSFTDVYGEDIVSASLNTTNYGTLEPGTDREEIISFTGITNNADGTVILTGVTRGLLAVTPFTADTSLRKSHAGSTIFVLTNNPQIYKAIFDYIDGIAIAGAPNASTVLQGLVEEATQAEIDAGTAAGALAQLFVNPSKLRAKAFNDYAADSVGTDAYAITTVPAITAYATGQRFTFKAGTANTGACTLNVCALGAKTIKKVTTGITTDLSTGDIVANQIVEVMYNGTDMQLLSQTPMLATDLIGVQPIATENSIKSRVYVVDGNLSGAAATNTVTVSHALGILPTYIRLTAQYKPSYNNATGILYGNSDGSATLVSGTPTYHGNYGFILNNGNGSGAADSNRGTLSSGIMLIGLGAGNDMQATIANVTTSQLDLVFTKAGAGVDTGTSANTIYWTIEVFY